MERIKPILIDLLIKPQKNTLSYTIFSLCEVGCVSIIIHTFANIKQKYMDYEKQF